MMNDNKPVLYKELKYIHDKLESEIVAATGWFAGAQSWSDVQAIVRAGLADKVFSVGDQLTCQRGGVNLVWDVIGIDHDTPADSRFTHSLTLQLHDCFPDQLQFDSAEAFYYASAEMAAGTYHFTVSNTDYQFTLSSAVPAGGQLILTYSGNTPSTIAISATKGGVAAGSIAVSVGNGGTEIATFNSISRVRYGSNNYKNSAIRQWLNSNAAAGSVWTPKTDYDRPPDWVSTADGFMKGLDADFVSVIGETNITFLNPRVDGSNTETIVDKFFLLSRSEVYGEPETENVNDGTPYPYYADNSDLSSAGSGADSNRMKYINNTAVPIWLRTPDYGSAQWGRAVSKVNGGITSDSADKSKGIAPACNII